MALRLQGYSGQAFSPKGDKERFVLPPAFRKPVIESSDGRVLCLDKHPNWTCLVGFGLSRQEELEAQLDREEDLAWKRSTDFDRDTRASQLFGYLQIPFDGSGRFVMPEHLAGLAAIEDQLYFHGAGRFFTLWNPAELEKMGPEWASAKAACQALASDSKGKRK